MAKKKKTNGAAGKPRAAGTGSRKRTAKGSRSAQSSRPRSGKPRQPALPGTAQIRNARLDHLCEEIGDSRDKMNAARGVEQSAIADSLAEMQRKGSTVYKHAGVELSRVPGGEKLRVRLTKDHGDADASSYENAAEGPDEGGDSRTGVDGIGKELEA